VIPVPLNVSHVPPAPTTRQGQAGRLPLEFEHSPQNSPMEANPQGWQKVAGGRSGQGERPPERRQMFQHPGEGCQTQTRDHGMAPQCGLLDPQFSHLVSGGTATPISSPHGRDESGTPQGCGSFPAPLPGGRLLGKPSATSGYRLVTLRVDCSGMSKLQRQARRLPYSKLHAAPNAAFC
jgi:hypothetical protein